MGRSKASSVRVVCNKCGAVSMTANPKHVGKKHHACSGRIKGSGTSKKECGTWQSS